MRFALEASQSLRIPGEIIGKEFQRDESVEASVLRLVDDAHSATAKFLEDAVVRDGLPDERGGIRHLPDMLGCGQRQVNEESLEAQESVKGQVSEYA